MLGAGFTPIPTFPRQGGRGLHSRAGLFSYQWHVGVGGRFANRLYQRVVGRVGCVGWEAWATARGVPSRGKRGWVPASGDLCKTPKRFEIVVYGDSCQSEIKGSWIPAFAGMTIIQRYPFARTRMWESVVGRGDHPHPNLPPSKGEGV